MNKILNSQTGTFLGLIAFVLYSLYAVAPHPSLWACASFIAVVGAVGLFSPDHATKTQMTNAAFLVNVLITLGVILEAVYLARYNPPGFSSLPLLALLVLLEIVLLLGWFSYNWGHTDEPTCK